MRRVSALAMLAAVLCMPFSANATLISVTTNVGFFGITFEKLGLETGWMNFIYDTSVSDSDPTSSQNLYAGSILSFTMVVEQVNRPALVFSNLGVRGDISFRSAGDAYTFQMFLPTVFDLSGVFGVGAFEGSMRQYPCPSSGTACADPPYPDLWFWESNPTASDAAYTVDGKVVAAETDWCCGNTGGVTARYLPEPGTLGLLGLGLLGLGVARRKAKSMRSIDTELHCDGIADCGHEAHRMNPARR